MLGEETRRSWSRAGRGRVRLTGAKGGRDIEELWKMPPRLDSVSGNTQVPESKPLLQVVGGGVCVLG